MKKVASLSYFFPAFNEAASVEALVRKAQQVLPAIAHTWEILPVDDGSSDATGTILRRLAAEDPQHIFPVYHEVNRGYGAAIMSGFGHARYDLIFFTDGDGQFDIMELPLLIEKIDGSDLVAGFRRHRCDPFARKVNGFLWGSLVRVLFGLPLRDVNCAYKLVKRPVIDNVTLSSTGAMISTELLVKVRKKGFRIVEVGVTHFPRKAGKPTGANWRVIMRAFGELFTLYKELQ